MNFSCPECGKHLSVDDDLAGKKAKCPKCGASVTIPSSEADLSVEGRDGCPRCGSYIAKGAVLCVKCGFNLVSGTRMTTETDAAGAAGMPHPSSGMILSTPNVNYRSPVKKVVALAALAGVAVVVWIGYGGGAGRPFGISDSRPLGTFAKIDQHLVAEGFVRHGRSLPAPLGYPSDCKTFKYLDETYAQRMGGEQEFVIVMAAASDQVLGVEGQYVREGALEDYKTRWRRTQRFLYGFWKEVGCGEPLFEGDVIASPVFAYHEDGRVEAEWAKMPEKISNFSRVRIAIALHPLAEMSNVAAPGGGISTDKAGAIPATSAPAPKDDPFAWEHPTPEDAAMLKKLKDDRASVADLAAYAETFFGMRRRFLLRSLKSIEQTRIEGIRNGEMAELEVVCRTAKEHLRLPDVELRRVYPGMRPSKARKTIQANHDANKARYDALNNDVFVRVAMLKDLFKRFGRDMEGSDHKARLRYRREKRKKDRAARKK